VAIDRNVKKKTKAMNGCNVIGETTGRQGMRIRIGLGIESVY